MQDFNIAVSGVTKLPKSSKTHKDTGPDGIVPILLSEFED